MCSLRGSPPGPPCTPRKWGLVIVLLREEGRLTPVTHAEALSVMSDSRAITLLTLGAHPVDSDQVLGQPPRENPTKRRPEQGPPRLGAVWEPRCPPPSDSLPGTCPSPRVELSARSTQARPKRTPTLTGAPQPASLHSAHQSCRGHLPMCAVDEPSPVGTRSQTKTQGAARALCSWGAPTPRPAALQNHIC